MIIEIEEIYNDEGQRVCLKKDKHCSMLLTTRFGTVFQCRLFNKEFGSKHADILSTYSNGYTKPLPECLAISEKKKMEGN